MDYGYVLSRAWKIIWEHKVLWIFGILMGLGNAGGSSSSAANGNMTWTVDQPPAWFDNFAVNFSDTQGVVLLCGAILLGLLIFALIIFLATIGKIGIIRGVSDVELGAQTSRLRFGELFRLSTPYFWRVFGMYFLTVLAFIVAIIVLAVPLAITVVGIFCLICLAPLAGFLLFAVLELAANAIVIENLGAIEGIKRSWMLVRTKFGPVFVMWLILLVVGLLGGFVLALPFFLLAIPWIVGSVISGSNTLQFSWGLWLVCGCVYLPFLLVLNGILQSYIGSAWTLTFLRLIGKEKAEGAPVMSDPNATLIEAEPVVEAG
jgi:hypothetical protein